MTDGQAGDGTTDTVARKAGRGLSWSLGGTLVTKMGSFAVGLVMARLLAPEDFGIYAVALAVTHFAMHVNDVGLIAATVQWRGRFEDMAPTGTTMAAVFGAAWYALFWCTAPLLAELGGNANATDVIRLLTAIILVDGITAVRTGFLQRTFKQDKLIIAIMVGFLANAAIAISMAVSGSGAISFAAGSVAESIVTGVLVWTFAKVPNRVGFDRDVARRLMVFGLPLAASWGVEAVLLNADYLIVGSVLGSAAVGFYLLAFNVSSWAPGLITTAVRYVSLSGFARMAEQGSLGTAVQRTVPLLVTAILPIAVVMGVLAPSLVTLLYGDRWAPAAPVLSVLVVLMVGRMLSGFVIDALLGAGHSRWTLAVHAGWAIPLLPALMIGVQLDGIRGAAIAHAVITLVVALPLNGYALHRIGVSLWPIAPALVRPAVAGLVAVATCLAVSKLLPGSPLVQLLVAGSAAFAVYLLVVVPRDVARAAVQLVITRFAQRRGPVREAS